MEMNIENIYQGNEQKGIKNDFFVPQYLPKPISPDELLNGKSTAKDVSAEIQSYIKGEFAKLELAEMD